MSGQRLDFGHSVAGAGGLCMGNYEICPGNQTVKYASSRLKQSLWHLRRGSVAACSCMSEQGHARLIDLGLAALLLPCCFMTVTVYSSAGRWRAR